MKTLTTLILASLLTVSATASAEGDHGKMHKRVSPLHKLFDANKDGVIDAGEISNSTTVLNGLDVNQDGQLDKVDFKALREAHGDEMRKHKRKGKKHCGKKAIFAKKDSNKDGVLDSSEIKAEFIEKFDSDQDGVVSKQEVKDKFAERRSAK
ncbi:EF hand family protein [Catenovulum agarivorans DS-2]|uniref:EF hand family protein n=1 Tax=Catenovulum agarivorans DS-2 TaxID=1328313 RepID=W7Q7N8_9ALTE|nr:hypothetical protein [Catenovulum agarivorans]EWH08809.1 EF hand family protein [Catenovulum agarivorans DS-2]